MKDDLIRKGGINNKPSTPRPNIKLVATNVKSKKEVLQAVPFIEAPDWMIIDSIRYCIGRMSYQVGVTCDWLIQNWDIIPKYTQNVIAKDIEKEIEYDNKCREAPKDKYTHYPLGHDCDRAKWEEVRKLWNFSGPHDHE